MSRINDLLKHQRGQGAQVRAFWRGVVASNPSDLSDRLSVVVPEFDPQFKWEGCRWQSRDDHSLPASGDPCVLVLDNRNEPWVIAWWPEGFD